MQTRLLDVAVAACRRLRRLPGWRLWLFVLAFALTVLPVYVGSYYRLSRRGLREARPYQLKGFFYVPLTELRGEDDPSWSRHVFLARVYTPLNVLDRALFGGDSPVRGVTWSLGK